MKNNKIADEKKQFITVTVAAAVIIFVVVFFVTFFVYRVINNSENNHTDTVTETSTEYKTEEIKTDGQADVQTTETTTEKITSVITTEKITQKEPEWTAGTVIEFPADDASWKLICVNKYRCVDYSVEENIKLSKVAGSSERMDSRAAGAYEEMYMAAKEAGFYLTPCSGYRSYSTQKRLYYEFVNEYINNGYSESEAHDLASKRRNPPGSSEHNLGICMDIICAASSANFQNTDEYAWLCENAHKYGFILRYPEDKVDITGVKFEPWHWRYVGVENAEAIRNSGLCLEEYLGIV